MMAVRVPWPLALLMIAVAPSGHAARWRTVEHRSDTSQDGAVPTRRWYMVIRSGRGWRARHRRVAWSLGIPSLLCEALASWHPHSDLEIDLDLGAANVYGLVTFALAGAALQYAVVTNVQLLAEAFRDEPGRGKYQVGVRYIVAGR